MTSSMATLASSWHQTASYDDSAVGTHDGPKRSVAASHATWTAASTSAARSEGLTHTASSSLTGTPNYMTSYANDPSAVGELTEVDTIAALMRR
jgi:hypothetical protein